jgi:hypothetical protein
MPALAALVTRQPTSDVVPVLENVQLPPRQRIRVVEPKTKPPSSGQSTVFQKSGPAFPLKPARHQLQITPGPNPICHSTKNNGRISVSCRVV